MDIAGKRLLILGGTSASLDLVKNAKEMGVYTIVTDECPVDERVAKQAADECTMVSTTDIDGLIELINQKNINGVFCGPSEFNIRNMLQLCEKAELRCYTTTDVWDLCANKDVFKSYCRKYNVDCTPEYEITAETTDEELEQIDYPIIIKPVDGCSSKGITVCKDKSEVRVAFDYAMSFSTCKRIIAEKYIENGGELFSVRYLLRDGEAYPYFVMDTYVVDPVHRVSLISAFTYAPSKYIDYYMTYMDAKVRKMLKAMGLKNGTAFIQSLPCDGKIYFHEMGYRLSGGMIYKLTDPMVGVNDMKMMIRYALGGEMITDEEIANLDVTKMKHIAAQLMVPLNVGTLTRIEGLEKAKNHPAVKDFIQYYQVGQHMAQSNVGTLQQHFGRFSIIADTEEEICATVTAIQNELRIYDTEGNRMNSMQFDLGRMEK